ncbi:MAG: NEW3 domain-containing protein [Chloroflexota bacterium]
MKLAKVARYVFYLAMLTALFSMTFGQAATAAATPVVGSIKTQVAPAEDKPDSLNLTTRFPVIKGKANASFDFEVEVKYEGTTPKTFDLSAKGPANFYVAITPQYDSKEISAIRIDPAKSFGETVKISATPLPWNLPAPGSYTFTFSAASGALKSTIDLKAEVTDNFKLSAETETGRLNTEATAGEENHLTIKVKNTGTSVLKNITFSSSKPEGWTVTFNPEKIDSLAVDGTRDIDVSIKPSGKAISGDYMVNLTVTDDSYSARANLDIRTTVLTPTIWGWVGVAIVVIVVAGLVYLFMRLGRR